MTPTTFHKNRTVRVNTSGIVQNALSKTFLSADIAAASGTLTVQDIAKFAVGKYVWINPFSETSEIIAVHASTAPSGTTITLASNTAFAHSSGEEVYYVEFNQVEVSHASTLAGSKSVLATVALDAGAKETIYLDTSQTSGYYFARFKDSVAATFSGYSDGVIYGGWADNTVGSIIDRGLTQLSLNLSNKITTLGCIDIINEGLRFIQGKQRRWPEHFTYNAIIGQAQRGTNVITMPSDAYDTETNRSVLAVRIGDNDNLHYLDPNQFDAQMDGVRVTQVRTQASANDTSLAVDNSYDFDDTGTLHVYVSGAQDAFTYTGVTRDDADGGTAAFTGIPSSGDNAIGQTTAVDTYVWQDEEEGTPLFYTVRNGNLEFYPLVDANQDNRNVYMDYAKVATAVDSEIDTIDYHRYDMLFFYFCWRLEGLAKGDGQLNMQSGWYIQFKEALNDAIRTMIPVQTRMKPKLNTMSRRRNTRPDVQNLSVDDQ